MNMDNQVMSKIIKEKKEEGMSLGEIAAFLSGSYPQFTYEQMFQKVRYAWSLIRDSANRTSPTQSSPASAQCSFEQPSFVRESPAQQLLGVTPETVVTESNQFADVVHGVSSVKTKNGSCEKTFEDTVILPEGEDLTPELIMKSRKLDPMLWVVEHFVSNPWQSRSSDGEVVTLWQTKLVVRPKKPGEVTLEEVKRFYENHKFIERRPVAPFRTIKNGKVLEICLADLHMGLFSRKGEVGENDYSIDVAKSRLQHCLSRIISENKNKEFEKVVFVTLGDVMHVDNSKQTTTSGTFQQIDSSCYNVYEESVNAVAYCIDTLLQLNSPVEYIYVPGNHDRDSGGHIALNIRALFANNPNVICDVSPNPIKARLYGVTLTGYHHGDCSKQNIGSMVPQNFPEYYSQAKFTKLKIGHLHHRQSLLAGVTSVEYQESLCGASLWEHQQGYGGPRGLRYCIYDTVTGDTTEGCVRA